MERASQIRSVQHFGVPVFSAICEEFQRYRESLKECVQQEMLKSPRGLVRSNRNGWHSEEDLHRWEHDSVRWLVREIEGFVGACIAGSKEQRENLDLVLLGSWANVSGFGAWNSPHNHLPCPWSGVYYVSVDNTIDAEEAGTSSGRIEFLNPLPLGVRYHREASVRYTPADGLMLLFPGYLVHWVQPNLSQNQRISISFNLRVVPKLRSGSPPPNNLPLQLTVDGERGAALSAGPVLESVAAPSSAEQRGDG